MTREEAIDFIYLECKQIFYDDNHIIYLDGSDDYPHETGEVEFIFDDMIVGGMVKTWDDEFFILKKLENGSYFFQQYNKEMKEYCDIVIKSYDYRKDYNYGN